MTTQWLDFDQKLFLAVNGLSGSGLDYIFAWPTFLGLGAVTLFLIFIFMLIWDKGAMSRKFVAVILSLLSLGAVAQILKEIVRRPRPFAFFYPEMAQGKVSVNCIFEMGVASSWPSGHAATVFAAAILLNYFYHQKLLFLYPLAVLVAFSRVYTGVHFPSDAASGALLGIVWGFLSIGVVQKIEAWKSFQFKGGPS
jgi:undecaprenyl-diphosphatase